MTYVFSNRTNVLVLYCGMRRSIVPAGADDVCRFGPRHRFDQWRVTTFMFNRLKQPSRFQISWRREGCPRAYKRGSKTVVRASTHPLLHLCTAHSTNANLNIVRYALRPPAPDTGTASAVELPESIVRCPSGHHKADVRSFSSPSLFPADALSPPLQTRHK